MFAVLSRILHKPYPVVMLAGGAVLALIPGLPRVGLAPDLVFLVMLPLLLFGGGWTTDFREFKRHLAPILWLALGLVVVTTACIAYMAHEWMGLPWGAAFVLGAILSPSDAIATEAIAEEVDFPKATETILSGESLVNDAAALVIYAFAVEAVMRGSSCPDSALADFFYVFNRRRGYRHRGQRADVLPLAGNAQSTSFGRAPERARSRWLPRFSRTCPPKRRARPGC